MILGRSVGGLFGIGGAEPLRVDIVKCRDLHRAVGQHRSGRAHHLLDLVRGKRAVAVEGSRLHREVDGLDAHVAFGLGVEGDARRRSGDLLRLAIGGGDGERIEGADICGVVLWPAASAILICTNGMLRTTSWSPTLRDGRHLHAPAVLGAGDLARRRKPRRSWRPRPNSPSSAAAVSFMISGGVASCSRPSSAASSATPIRMHEVTPVRNVPESQRAEISRLSGGPLRPSAKQRRLVAEPGYGCLGFVHSERRLLPLPVSGSHICCRDNCLPRQAKSTKAEPFAGFALSIPPPACARKAHPREEAFEFQPALGPQ